MKCYKCNQVIPDDSEFCHFCGNRISADIPTVTPYKQVKVTKSKRPRNPIKKKTKKAIRLTLISIISLAIIAMLIFFFVVPLLKYNHAQKLLEHGKYDLAYTAFSKLGDYSDSQDKLMETRYLQAVDYRNKGDFDVANNIFESLGDYRESKALIHTHEYSVSDSIAPTCTTLGEDTYACVGCEASYSKTIKMVSHDYVLSQQKKPTCTTWGEDIFNCSICGASYNEAVKMVPHNYLLTKQINASCVSNGEKSYSCSMCGDSYSEMIVQKAHSWKSATCSAPKTCTACGKSEGSALGHSNDAVCTRCGVTIFKTLTYSGTGSKVIDYFIPKGKYKVTATMTSGEGSVDVKVHYTESYGDTYMWFYLIEAGTSEIEYIYGPNDGSIVVNASSDYYGNSGWRVTIEAVGN